MNIEELYNDYPDRSRTGTPSLIAREGTNFVFGPVSIGGTLKGIYYAKLTALSDSNTTNWYTTNAPEVLLYGALLEAQPFIMNDARIQTWGQMYQGAIDSIRDEHKNAEFSRGSLVQRVS